MSTTTMFLTTTKIATTTTAEKTTRITTTTTTITITSTGAPNTTTIDPIVASSNNLNKILKIGVGILAGFSGMKEKWNNFFAPYVIFKLLNSFLVMTRGRR